ncbi:bifunctional [glutamate--ammonia ligase]-adenylyl-L-tyrosine phosphorylase/[glutamate--ammonia-ligase] adenylyltransferase [Thalassotalea profundi]|uniref:Bifunctional glutamine synthetase adenylyltransferase/adenylyl-removing enzyme n=1 Tax=Thalassotalea profundi TaxID=2036687 RepID=A0ABQ3IH20_9GAMM|nr:bifunctional [glutamate--ammonia ligase]-adenylyl-L-tyrosine phosphorylase/[glutamate--ammonia-ligase] adenylyltransferase [Thalassotalea profundi]GHE84276.1 glutamate-ammonia-ligase adenylyltransferase [Thalassotalea profundi]
MKPLARKNFLPILIEQQNKRWVEFTDQHGEQYAKQLSFFSEQQLSDFQRALALSDFIFNSAVQAPELVIDLFRQEHLDCSPDYVAQLSLLLENCATEEQLHRVLRRFRLQQMVAIAVNDFLCDAPLDTSLKCLSSLADALILSALNWLSQFCYKQWGVPKNQDDETMPLLVYGMGKLGGNELNFSSDIDLIFAYPESGKTKGARRELDNQQFFIRLAQKLISALNQQTVDGFVYRVDMRLRPFGDSGPLVLTFSAMEDYYQEQGRDWERYAMLKARLIGEGKYHHQLSSLLRPFVYRRYIDFSVIDSLRRMKGMIAQEVRRKQLSNNIKLGAGGIREVEFIVQVFQLIRGGRIKELQERNLLTVLPLLVQHGEITEQSKVVLENTYRFLRRVENIIQALADQQTQTLPDNPLDQARILYVLGDEKFPSWQAFLAYLSELMQGVHQEFNVLIGEESPHHQTEDQHWITLWDGQWDDEDSVEWITQSQPDWPATKIWQLLKDFYEESKKRSIGTRGRQVIDKLIPLMLSYLVDLKADETALERILLIIEKVSTRTAYLELLYENEGALKHLVKLCQISQWVAEHIIKYPILLDELIDPTLLNSPPALTSYAQHLREGLLRVPEEDLEAQMEFLRQFKQAQQLRIAVADIVGVLPITKVSDHLTALAQAIVGEVINMAWQQISIRYGVPSSVAVLDHKAFAVIGYGKMGGIELGYGSDLDLVFIHNCPIDDTTNGSKQVLAGEFYSKLAQRITHIFNTRMNSGILYELDMRLRPSGNSGVLVIHVDSFEQYQIEEAWTWEHQALVRTRAIYGHQALIEQFERIRKNTLSKNRNVEELKKSVIEMRDKMQNHLDKSTLTESDIKQSKGGLVDIEFLAQYLVLAHYNQFTDSYLPSDNIRIFQMLLHWQVITDEECQQLINHYCELRDFGHHCVLKNKANLMPLKEFTNHAQVVMSIFNKYL